MSTMQALLVEGKGKIMLREIPIPEAPEGHILVRTKAVALNPTDWKHVDFVDCQNTIVGCDFSGVVELVGANVRKPWKKGDRVAGWVHGCNSLKKQSGAFGEFVLAKADLQLKIPSHMSFESAATLGVGIATIGQNLYQSLDLPIPKSISDHVQAPNDSQSSWILIYGGATATGSLAIQFAKLSGLQVATTCSDVNRSFVYERGADLHFDYHDSNVGSQIREATHDALEMVFDTVSTPQTATVCASAMSADGGCYNAILNVRCPRDDVETDVCMAYAMFGDPWLSGGPVIAANPANLEFAASWATVVEELLDAKKIQPHPYKVMHGGLEAIENGLQVLREGKARACKLVYVLDQCAE
ncbi:oxidoreductase [Penicillium malachiteum]|uniref:Oxidoreductase n=1 Tax=Penicillium malachiteum TaxID=1324776 RepID=A0AAD6HJX7_9EURO|nr:oxidoreductase [Penicillium malachiteum]